MLYLTNLHALNLPCLLDTCGDWHTSALDWNKLHLKNSEDSIFGDYGIELNKAIPEHKERYNVANHIRAILDLLAEKKFSLISNFKDDFICNDSYTQEIFEKVYELLPNNDIEAFMRKTYGRRWRHWIGERHMEK